jgi:hypothetical protein
MKRSLTVREIDQLNRDVLVLAATVKLNVPVVERHAHRCATRVLRKLLPDAQARQLISVKITGSARQKLKRTKS